MDQTRYKEKYLEKKFLESENFMRLFFYVCPALYFIFWIADYLKYAEKSLEFLVVRLLVSISLLSSYLIYRKKKSFTKNQVLTVAWTVICSSGIAYMLHQSNDPLSFYYLIGFTLIAIFSLVFGVFDKVTFYIALLLNYVPYIIVLQLNSKFYFENWKEFFIFNIVNAGFVLAIISIKFKKNQDFDEIIKAELKLENEIRDREKIIEQNAFEISKLNAIELELIQKEFQFDLALKVSHDIRSPVSTLNIITSKIENQDLKNLQKNVVEQILNISNELLNYAKSSSEIFKNNENSTIPILKLLNIIETEYRLKSHYHNRQINFFNKINTANHLKINRTFATQIYSIINNLIQNSIDATEHNSKIEVKIYFNHNKEAVLEVVDEGKGIPLDILEALGNKIVTFGKNNGNNKSGNGIAIFNAKKILSKIGGNIKISSVLGNGTSVQIILPQSVMNH